MWSHYTQSLKINWPNCLTFSNTTSTQAKRILYLTFVRSTLLCCPLWWPFLIRDILILEKHSDVLLNLFWMTIQKHPSPSFNISNYITFNSSNTRSSNIKLCHKLSSDTICSNSYFHRLPRLWNVLQSTDFTYSLSFNTIKQRLKKHLSNPKTAKL